MTVLNFLEDGGELYVKCSDIIDFLTDIENNPSLYSEDDRKLAVEIKESLVKSMNKL